MIEVKNVEPPGKSPFYNATLETLAGKQEVRISIAHKIHVFKSNSTLLKKMDIPAVDKLPLGKRKSYSIANWLNSLEEAKTLLSNALLSSEWQSAGRETSQGTVVDFPFELKDKIICGVSKIRNESEASVTILAGKVLDVYNTSGPNESPFYKMRIDGPLGILEIDITMGLHLVNILR